MTSTQTSPLARFVSAEPRTQSNISPDLRPKMEEQYARYQEIMRRVDAVSEMIPGEKNEDYHIRQIRDDQLKKAIHECVEMLKCGMPIAYTIVYKEDENKRTDFWATLEAAALAIGLPHEKVRAQVIDAIFYHSTSCTPYSRIEITKKKVVRFKTSLERRNGVWGRKFQYWGSTSSLISGVLTLAKSAKLGISIEAAAVEIEMPIKEYPLRTFGSSLCSSVTHIDQSIYGISYIEVATTGMVSFGFWDDDSFSAFKEQHDALLRGLKQERLDSSTGNV